MNDIPNREDGLERLQAALSARSMVKDWAAGAELMELIRAVHEAGWLERMHGRTTVEELASKTGTSTEAVSDVLEVLASAGVVQAEDTSFQLSEAFDALVQGASGVDLSTALAAHDLARICIAEATGRVDSRSGFDGALALARDWGVRAGGGARQLYGLVYEALPEYRDRLAAGGPLLDVGSGVGGALLTTLSLFPGLRAVGVEIVPAVAAETRDRAEEAGVASRVAVRAVDARSLEDESAFAVCYWAQGFFPAGTRTDVLKAIFRALQPGGLLLMQETFPSTTARDGCTTRSRLDRLVYRRQNIAYGLSAEDLVAEAEAAGFQDLLVLDSPAGRLVMVRKPRR
ncbi:SAM-dependent methyltransferase [Streptomyces sediminimaris]|uniref:SAM-dependent methyltransferase n=1 Tax=Streptomyces sediminimaris TaxID=3383721 RepID=UPI0039995CB2